MEKILTQFAVAETGKPDLFGSLGIDWRMLAMQLVAFLILLFILRKWVYPPLVAMLDKRDANLRESAEAAEAAKEQAEAAGSEAAKLIKQAKKDAAEIVNDAKSQASQIAADSDKKAKERAERIVASAHDDITREVANAKKALHNETLELVALATEKVAGKVVTKSVDEKSITAAVKEASK